MTEGQLKKLSQQVKMLMKEKNTGISRDEKTKTKQQTNLTIQSEEKNFFKN